MHCSCSIFCCPSNCHTAVSPWFSICTLITLLTFFVPSLQFAILNSFVAEHVAQIYLADFLLPIVMASIIGCDKQIHRLLCDYFLQMHAILCPNTGHSLLSSRLAQFYFGWLYSLHWYSIVRWCRHQPMASLVIAPSLLLNPCPSTIFPCLLWLLSILLSLTFYNSTDTAPFLLLVPMP